MYFPLASFAFDSNSFNIPILNLFFSNFEFISVTFRAVPLLSLGGGDSFAPSWFPHTPEQFMSWWESYVPFVVVGLFSPHRPSVHSLGILFLLFDILTILVLIFLIKCRDFFHIRSYVFFSLVVLSTLLFAHWTISRCCTSQ